VLDPSHFEVKIAIAKLKNYKLPGIDQILAKVIQTGGDILLSKIHELIMSIWNEEDMPELWNQLTRNGDKTDCNNYCEISLLSTSTQFYSICWLFCNPSIRYAYQVYHHFIVTTCFGPLGPSSGD
jgi:hypothetical protein